MTVSHHDKATPPATNPTRPSPHPLPRGVVALFAAGMIAGAMLSPPADAQETGNELGACCYYWWFGERYVQQCGEFTQAFCESLSDATWYGCEFRCADNPPFDECLITPTTCGSSNHTNQESFPQVSHFPVEPRDMDHMPVEPFEPIAIDVAQVSWEPFIAVWSTDTDAGIALSPDEIGPPPPNGMECATACIYSSDCGPICQSFENFLWMRTHCLPGVDSPNFAPCRWPEYEVMMGVPCQSCMANPWPSVYRITQHYCGFPIAPDDCHVIEEMMCPDNWVCPEAK